MATSGYNEMELTGWGRYELHRSKVFRPATHRQLNDILKRGPCDKVIPRGLGRSYGDSATIQEGSVILNGRLDRMLAFDPEQNLLTCESGVTFADVLRVFGPRGYFLPVSPGTKFVTLGGAIAADVHGKNHHLAGSFGNFVVSFDLLTGNQELMHCSRTENSSVFWATIGGMGLTGYIVTASFHLLPIETSWMQVNYRQVPNLDELLTLVLDPNRSATYSVAWIDCLARSSSLGRAVLMEAEHARRAELTATHADSPLALPKTRKLSIPCMLPSLALNQFSVRLFNTLYYHGHPTRSQVTESYEPFFYPLDSIRNWNRIYGKRGFVQYQALLPLESCREGIRKLLDEISGSRLASFLAVLKRTGAADEGMLSFCKPGITLACDIPNAGQRLRDLTRRLDQLLVDFGGRLYLAKDSLTTPGVIADMYPRLDEFRQVRSRIDPQNRFVSAQSRRLGIVS